MGEFGISFLPQTFFSWRPGVRTITTGPLPEGWRGVSVWRMSRIGSSLRLLADILSIFRVKAVGLPRSSTMVLTHDASGI